MSAAVDRGERLLREGRFDAAALAFREALGEAGLTDASKAEASSMLGLALLSQGNPADALAPLEKAVQLDPAESMFRYNLGRGYELAGRFDDAIAAHREAVRMAPGQVQFVAALGQAFAGAGRFAEAVETLAPLAQGGNAHPIILRLLAKCLQGAGDTHAAIDIAEKLCPRDVVGADRQGRADALFLARLRLGALDYAGARKIAEDLVERDAGDADAATLLAPLALWSEGSQAATAIILSCLREGGESPELVGWLLAHSDDVDTKWVERAQAMAADEKLPPTQRADLLLALAQRADRNGDNQQAWELAERGNALNPVLPAPDRKAQLAGQIAIWRDTPPRAGDGFRPIYLCGVARSGQSLLQSVLGAAPGVVSAGERGALLPQLLGQEEKLAAMSPSERADHLAQLAKADRRGLERIFGPSEICVDKNPFNFIAAGSIARIHPGARFVAMLRDPADVAVSIFIRRFPPAYEYANHLEGIVSHLEFAVDALEAWRAADLDIIAVSYEEFAADPEGEGARLFGRLDLDWDAEFLAPRNRNQPVPTFSAAQVRQPIRLRSDRVAAPYREYLVPFADRLEAIRKRQEELVRASAAS